MFYSPQILNATYISDHHSRIAPFRKNITYTKGVNFVREEGSVFNENKQMADTDHSQTSLICTYTGEGACLKNIWILSAADFF